MKDSVVPNPSQRVGNSLPIPAGICLTCGSNSEQLVIHSGEAISTYCPHNKTGGIYYGKFGWWMLVTPVGQYEFAANVKHRLEKMGIAFDPERIPSGYCTNKQH